MGSQHKAYDASAMFWDAVDCASGFATTDSPVYSATLDLGMANADMWDGGEIVIHWEGVVGTGATLTFDVCTKATSPPTTAESILTTEAIAIAALQADDEYRIALPSKGMLQYVRVAITIATAHITAGTIHGGLLK